jgi:ABC-type polysaccharide transport system permease subunit
MIARNPSKLYYPAAAAFFQSLIGFVLVLTTNAIVRKVEPEMAMF